MKLYDAELDMRYGLSDKALEWYYHTDLRVYRNGLGLFFTGYDRANTEGPYTLEDLNRRFEHYQHILEDEDIDWPDPEEEEWDFYIDYDDLVNDIDRRTQE